MNKTAFLCILMFFMAVVSFGCSQENSGTAFSVQLSIPEEITVDASDMSISFRVVGGNAPQQSDLLLFKSNVAEVKCGFSNITTSRASATLPETFESGDYSVSVLRGADIREMGRTKIIVERHDVEIEGDYNVYGKVISSAGEPLSGILLSDGIQFAKTNNEGIYSMVSDKSTGCIFIVLPSGFEAVKTGILPSFHYNFKKDADTAERFDFKLTPSQSQDNHTVLVFGDMHLANRSNNKDRTQFAEFTADVNNYLSANPAENVYGITLGDMTWDLYWYKNNYYFPEYLNDANVIKGIPMFHTIGNHDHDMEASGDVMTVEKYRTYIAPTYYSFNIGKIHYVVLDNILCTNDGKGGRTYDDELTQTQIEWLEKDLSLADKNSTVVLTMHAPLYSDGGINNMSSTAKIEELLGQFSQAHVFTGHTHKVYNVDKLSGKRIFEHNAGAVCATWWWSGAHTPGIHIGQDGAPGGYTVVDVNGTDLKWQFKPTGSSAQTQFRTYDRNKISITADKYLPEASAENKANFEKFATGWKSESSDNIVYINVWNYDPEWTVDVTESGKSLKVERVSISDPLHLISYTAPAMNSSKTIASGKPSFPTYANRHMFKVKASSADADLVVKVTDRFGNSYTEQMNRPKDFTVDNYR